MFAEKTVDRSQNPLELKSEAREAVIDDDSDVDVFVWTSVGKLLASGAPAHLSKTLEKIQEVVKEHLDAKSSEKEHIETTRVEGRDTVKSD